MKFYKNLAINNESLLKFVGSCQEIKCVTNIGR